MTAKTSDPTTSVEALTADRVVFVKFCKNGHEYLFDGLPVWTRQGTPVVVQSDCFRDLVIGAVALGLDRPPCAEDFT
jgi:hypothetical protein